MWNWKYRQIWLITVWYNHHEIPAGVNHTWQKCPYHGTVIGSFTCGFMWWALLCLICNMAAPLAIRVFDEDGASLPSGIEENNIPDDKREQARLYHKMLRQLHKEVSEHPCFFVWQHVTFRWQMFQHLYKFNKGVLLSNTILIWFIRTDAVCIMKGSLDQWSHFGTKLWMTTL